MTPQYRYAVCCGVPKSTTVPVPVLPILETLRVFPYLCRTLSSSIRGQLATNKSSLVQVILEVKVCLLLVTDGPLGHRMGWMYPWT